MMADFGDFCVFLSLLFSSCLQPGCCQYQSIDLTFPGSGVSCSMSTLFSNPNNFGTSLNCTGAINGDKRTIWTKQGVPNANCIYTDNKNAEVQYWQVDLRQTRNIHRITIYPEMGTPKYMTNITVYVDQTSVFTFPTYTAASPNRQVITSNLPRRGNIIKLTKRNDYVTLCELQLEDCVPGSYGAECRVACSAGCQSDTCDSINGSCSCRTGWSGANCQVCSSGYYRQGDNCVRCGAGCQAGTCRGNGECDCQTTNWQTPFCQTCKPGYYGTNCDMECSAGCANTCNTVSGTCTCRTGWTGSKCDVCSSDYYRQGDNCVPCGAGCQAGTCRDNGECDCRTTNWQTPFCQTCIPGYYGTNCDMECSVGCDDTCNTVSGVCTCKTGWTGSKCDVCADGYYGASCSETCSAGCRDTCNKQDGTCSCKTGWSGDKCDECSDGYYHNTTALDSSACQKCGDGCVTTSCDDVTGRCTCRPGWQETTCQECALGQSGDDCQHTCSVGCENICDLNTGSCTCRQGWDGPTCETCATGYYNKSESGDPIPSHCIPCGSGCSDTCDGQSGYCTCRPGWEPPFCDQECSAGRYGQDCQETCPPGCDGPCHVITGNCSCGSQWRQLDCTVCSPGHYSPNLGCKACGAGCEDVTSCDTLSGSCSCRTGWEPPTCHVCKTKLWGDNCTLACGDCAGDGSCNRITGDCTFGSSGQESDSNTGAIVGSVVGVGLFLGICVLVGALLIIRSRRSRQPARTEEQHENNISTAQEKETSIDFANAVEKSRGSMTEGGDGSDNYDKLASYENSDDIKPYTSLQTNHPSTHGPHTLSTTAKDIGVYEIPDVEYENTRKK